MCLDVAYLPLEFDPLGHIGAEVGWKQYIFFELRLRPRCMLYIRTEVEETSIVKTSKKKLLARTFKNLIYLSQFAFGSKNNPPPKRDVPYQIKKSR